jgi:hypothetical protein
MPKRTFKTLHADARRIVEETSLVRIQEGPLLSLVGPLKTFIPARSATPNPLYEWMFQLVVNSMNYCYWIRNDNGLVGKPPGGASSQLYRLTKEHFEEMLHGNFEPYIAALRQSGLPHMNQRLEDLAEVQRVWSTAWNYGVNLAYYTPDEVLTWIDRHCPGFTRDPFLKRPALLVQELHFQANLFTPAQLADVPLPADYHIPRILREMGVLSYDGALADRVDRQEELPSHGAEESALRAAAIECGRRLAAQSQTWPGWVDAYLWSVRKLYNGRHHLTLTADY